MVEICSLKLSNLSNLSNHLLSRDRFGDASLQMLPANHNKNLEIIPFDNRF